MSSLNLLCALLLVFGIYDVKSERKVTAVLNPNCNLESCLKKEVILIHVKAEGSDDTLHHLWDFSKNKKPSFLIALTDKNATLSVEWTSFSHGQANTVKFDPLPSYVYGTVIDKLIEFNDETDSGVLNQSIPVTNTSYVTLYDTAAYDWKYVSLSNSSSVATLNIEATSIEDPSTKAKKSLNGTIRFVMSAYGGEDHAETLPHLLHSGNASQMDLTLDQISPKYKNSRFGLSLVTVSSEKPGNDTVEIKSRKTMDDEHAPGVFTIVEVVTPNVMRGECGGYLQWRPVVYTSPAREMTSSSETVQYSVVNVSDPSRALTNTLLWSTVGPQLVDSLVTATNVTFGMEYDGFYNKKKFVTWTMLAGYGHPPAEQFSMLVTLVLLLGLGLPAVLILTGTVCIIMRRLQRNEDLFFSG